jgi:GNAT superfamily N-acetyltransferase
MCGRHSPIIGRDWSLLDPGTPVRTFTLNRRNRDRERAARFPAASLGIDRTELLPGAGGNWTMLDADGCAVAHLAAQVWPRLSPYQGRPADAIVGGMAVKPEWRGIGVEEKLLLALRDEIAGRQVREVVLVGYRLGDAPYLRAHGFSLAPRIATTFSIELDVLDR